MPDTPTPPSPNTPLTEYKAELDRVVRYLPVRDARGNITSYQVRVFSRAEAQAMLMDNQYIVALFPAQTA